MSLFLSPPPLFYSLPPNLLSIHVCALSMPPACPDTLQPQLFLREGSPTSWFTCALLAWWGRLEASMCPRYWGDILGPAALSKTQTVSRLRLRKGRKLYERKFDVTLLFMKVSPLQKQQNTLLGKISKHKLLSNTPFIWKRLCLDGCSILSSVSFTNLLCAFNSWMHEYK